MKFKLYKEYGALNSPPVFDALEKGIINAGHQVVLENEDISVIWSILWSGRMRNNRKIYYSAINSNRPVLIVEVGNLKRGVTWRISLNHINNLGIFANTKDLDHSRPEKLGLSLSEFQKNRGNNILIACQHQESLQWEGMPPMKTWLESIVSKIQEHTRRQIVVRPHPRSPFSVNIPGIIFERPQKIPNTYDNFDISYNYHCVINHNSGPAVQAAIQGVPILCDSSSLAAPLSIDYKDLETPYLSDRKDWFLKLCHTEWTVEEIQKGIPIIRLFP